MKRMTMRATLMIAFFAALLLTAGCASMQKGGMSSDMMTLSEGDQVYVCGCGTTCQCGTISKKPGKCGCGGELVPGEVVQMEGTWAVVKISDNGAFRLQSFNTAGKYACTCGSGCECSTVSMQEGTCGCGMPLEKVR